MHANRLPPPQPGQPTLDALVLKAYGWSAKADVLANLLDLNLELAELEADGRAIVGPWDPNLKAITTAPALA